jgi:ribonuclease HI
MTSVADQDQRANSNCASAQYLLFTEVSCAKNSDKRRWRFILEQINGSDRFEASDNENNIGAERMQLLSLVRGLEAIDQPAQVTVVTSSQYVSRGVKHGIHQWRQNDWKWERFGEMLPVRDEDLWKRVQRAISVHQVDCRLWKNSLSSYSAVASAGEEHAKMSGLGSRLMRRLNHLGTLVRLHNVWLASHWRWIKSLITQYKLQSPIYRISTD